MESFIQFALLLIALLVLPIGYAWLCQVMRQRCVPHPPRLAFFFLFGTAGGWALAFMLAPSGLAAMGITLLLSAAPLAMLSSSVHLAVRPERTSFHRFAMRGGFAYCGILALGAIIATWLR